MWTRRRPASTYRCTTPGTSGIGRLSRGPASASERAGPFERALPTVVQPLGVLEAAGIAPSARAGRVRTYQPVPGALPPAADWIGRQRLPAERRLDRLGALLNRPDAPAKERDDMNHTIEESHTHCIFYIAPTDPDPGERE